MNCSGQQRAEGIKNSPAAGRGSFGDATAVRLSQRLRFLEHYELLSETELKK